MSLYMQASMPERHRGQNLQMAMLGAITIFERAR